MAVQNMLITRRAAVSLVVASASGSLHQTTRAAADAITLAQVSPFTGPLSGAAEAQFLGSKIYFDRLNVNGGVAGRPIRVLRIDDRFDPAETVRQIADLATRIRPVAFLNLMTAPAIARVIADKVLERMDAVVIRSTPGAESLRSPGSARMFHVQAGDNAQIEKILGHLEVIGHQRIALVCQATPFGEDARVHATALAPQRGLRIVKTLSIPLGAMDLEAQVRSMSAAGAQTYVVALTPAFSAAFIRDLRAAGDRTQIYSMSYASAELIVKEAGVAAAKGVAIAQVLPNPESDSTALTRAYRADLQRYGPTGSQPSSLSLTGYVVAAVAALALKGAGSPPTVRGLLDALHSLHRTDLGGYLIDFSRGGQVGGQACGHRRYGWSRAIAILIVPSRAPVSCEEALSTAHQSAKDVKLGSVEFQVGSRAWGLVAWTSSLPTIRKMTVVMVDRRVKPRARRLAAWNEPLIASRNPLV